MAKSKEKPVKEYRSYGIRATIWEMDKGAYSVTITKSYKDKKGEWQETNVYFQEDLPKLTLVSQKAYEFIALREISND